MRKTEQGKKSNTQEYRKVRTHREKLRLGMRIGFVVILILSTYFTLLLGTVKAHCFTCNIAEMIEIAVTTGFMWKLFTLLFIMLTFVSVLAAGKSEEEKSRHPIDTNRKSAAADNYGRSEFETPSQYRSLAQIRAAENCHGHILGMLDDKARKCIDFFPDPKDPTAHVNNNIFSIGASGSGKTFSIGKTYCYQSIKMGHSIMHTDPKGELYADMANTYREHGYIVRRLNFNNPKKSDGWDCMKSLRNEKDISQLELLVDKFATAVVSQSTTNTSADVFYSGPITLLKAILLRILLDDDIPEQEKNIRTVYEWVTNPGGIEFLKSKFQAATIKPKLKPCLGPWGSYIGASENLGNNIRVNLSVGLSVISTKIISDILSTDDVDLLLPAQVPCAYFIQFPVPNDTFKFPVALFFTMFFEALQAYATSLDSHKLPREVDCMLDEFAQAGVMPQWDQRMSVFRSYGINIFMIVQTMTQFKTLYKDSIDTIISNCATWLVLGSNDYNSAKMFSDRIGQTTIEVESESKHENMVAKSLRVRRFEPIWRQYSVGTGKAALLTADEIMKLPANTLLIVFQRHNPIWANSIPHYFHPFAKTAVPTREKDEPFFYDRDNVANNLPTREARHKAEANRIKRYWEEHELSPVPDNIDDAPYSGVTLPGEMLQVIAEDSKSLVSSIAKLLHVNNKNRSAATAEETAAFKPGKAMEDTKRSTKAEEPKTLYEEITVDKRTDIHLYGEDEIKAGPVSGPAYVLPVYSTFENASQERKEEASIPNSSLPKIKD